MFHTLLFMISEKNVILISLKKKKGFYTAIVLIKNLIIWENVCVTNK